MKLDLCKGLFLGVLAVSAGACSKNPAPPPATSAADLGPGRVAVVNGHPIAESVLRMYALASARKNLDDLSAEERAKLLDDLIGVELLSQEAEKEGIAGSRTVAAQLELQRLQLVARAMVSSYLEKNSATETELQQLYNENLPRLSAKQYKARHILVETEVEAKDVIAQLQSGKDFLALAKERESGPTGPNGGDLGWFTTESMAPAVVAAASTMKVGSFSAEPVQTEFGYHVLLLEDSRQQDPPTLEAIRKELAGAIERQRLAEHIQALRDEATVAIEP